LTRFEGILFLAAIPALTLIYSALSNKDESWQQMFRPVTIFILIFTVLAAPQVIRVSDYMNTFSLNGRTTWSILLNAPDNKSTAEKIYGLDFDEGMTNLHYLQLHPEAQNSLVSDTGVGSMLMSYSKTVLLNLEDLHDNVANPTFGLPVLIFAVIGLYFLVSKRRYWTAFLLTSFLMLGLAAPLLHNVSPRHIAVMGPLMFLLAATGIYESIVGMGNSFSELKWPKEFAIVLLTAICLTPYALNLGRILFKPDKVNKEYDEIALTEAAGAFRASVGIADSERPTVIARKGYFGNIANARTILMPYTDLAGLLRFMEINNTDYIFLESNLVGKYPFFQELLDLDDNPPFTVLYRSTVSPGEGLILMKTNQ
jgi:hypothetical protein